MKLSKKYVIGTHVMFYEIEMYKEFVDGLINLIDPIQNKENIHLHFCFNKVHFSARSFNIHFNSFKIAAVAPQIISLFKLK